jgi:hypothetical protein
MQDAGCRMQDAGCRMQTGGRFEPRAQAEGTLDQNRLRNGSACWRPRGRKSLSLRRTPMSSRACNIRSRVLPVRAQAGRNYSVMLRGSSWTPCPSDVDSLSESWCRYCSLPRKNQDYLDCRDAHATSEMGHSLLRLRCSSAAQCPLCS